MGTKDAVNVGLAGRESIRVLKMLFEGNSWHPPAEGAISPIAYRKELTALLG
jgi:hypothetical protein